MSAAVLPGGCLPAALSTWTPHATAHPACTGAPALSASLRPHPQLCLLGLSVPQPSDTSIRALGLLLTPVSSLSLHTCVAYPICILQVASCWSNNCRPAQDYANQWPSLPPIGLRLCQIQQGLNSSLGEEWLHSKFVFPWLLPFCPGVSCRFSHISWLLFYHSLMIFIVISSCLNYCVVSASWLDPNRYRDIFYIFI